MVETSAEEEGEEEKYRKVVGLKIHVDHEE